ncbi:uncharacterized protein [Eurosta solidaginis]|uniref:uncharacterized protein n=1 Tax=Eurosta solidaginis TaxID=178769 RepID=UPI00353163A1
MCCDITPALLLLTLVQLLVGVVHIKPTNGIVDAENCWNESEECLIHAMLHRFDEPPHSAGLTVEIDCQAKAALPAMNENNHAPAFLLRRLEHAASLLLDGCHTPLDVQTYGMEYLSNCDTVPKVFMERFHTDTLLPFNCPSGNNSAMQVEMLGYSNNELATIATDTFANLPQLRELYFARNSLRHIARSAFDTLRVVERMQIVHEPLLALKDADLFERTGVADLQLMHLKYINSKLFEHLPETLRQIVVAHTTFDSDAVIVRNPQLLRNISINDCTLKSFVLLESTQTMSVQYINLSNNALTDLRVDFLSNSVGNNASIAAVETLDLSANELTQLPLAWLNGLRKLRCLHLRDNRLVKLSLPTLIDAIPLVALLDLRGNQLSTLADAALVATALSWAQVHIKIDRNPWSCLWLLEFAHTHPEKFRVFQYEKFISQINVNGLKCVPVEVSASLENVTTASAAHTSVTTTAPYIEIKPPRNAINASTYKLIYGGPWDYKRSQRAEALVIVFLLPVGVALLFTLLYMWIKCQKVFHLSFYRSFTWSQSNIGRRFASAERFDIVRQLPPLPSALNVNNNHNNNDDYETPLSGGIGSVCNCHNNIGTPTYANEKCRKLHHVTYEELPSERPFKIYEDIIGDDDATDTETYAQPFYDHLSFTQPAKSDSD